MKRKGYSTAVLRRLRTGWDGLCFYCQRDIRDKFRFDGRLLNQVWDAATVDHMTPLSRGGEDHISNMVLACGACNWEKSALTVAEYNQRKHATYSRKDEGSDGGRPVLQDLRPLVERLLGQD